MPKQPSTEAVAASVAVREERDGTKRIVVSAFVDNDEENIAAAKAAMKKTAEKFLSKG